MTTTSDIDAPRSARKDLLFIVLASVIVFWNGIGTTGLSMSEGLRVIPAWEMMDTGDYVVTRMFGEAYSRKPPGMMWAIAASSAVFGQTEFAARAVSALACTLMGVAAWWFARRWFGPVGGLVAGLAQVLTPFLWEAGRSAEIEALHTLGVQLACLGMLDAGVRRRLPLARSYVPACSIAIGLIVAVLTKGPAGAPVMAAALGASLWLAVGSGGGEDDGDRRRLSRWLWAVLPAGAVGLVVLAGVFAVLANARKDVAVTQSPGEFLWDASKIVSILTLPLVGVAAALPSSLVLLAWPALAARRSVVPRDGVTLAIAAAGVASVVIYAVVGVSNPRYTMPAAPLWPLALGGLFTARVLARPNLKASLMIVAMVLAGAGLVLAQISDRARDGDGGRGSGRPAGVAIGRAIAACNPGPGAEVWADGAVEARPEVLLYARREAMEQGFGIRPRWSSALLRPFVPPDEAFVLVRVEGEVVEGGESVLTGRRTIWEGRAAKFSVRLLGPRTVSP
jgi:4-amino-4-deoxy-L-arabinose transferase-like glycosyltransferase